MVRSAEVSVAHTPASKHELTISSLRPKPLGRSFWAFLFPHVPLVPSVPSDVSDAGRSPAKDAQLFPSDEQLSQRVLWICTLIVAGWTVLALAAFLPLYMVSTPCLADSVPPARFSGVYSALQEDDHGELSIAIPKEVPLKPSGSVGVVFNDGESSSR